MAGITNDKKGHSLSNLENDKFIESQSNPERFGVIVLNSDGSDIGSSGSLDGIIPGGGVESGDISVSGSTTSAYFDMAKGGFKYLTATYRLLNTTLTLEGTNSQSTNSIGETIPPFPASDTTATNTDGTGVTLVSGDLVGIGNGDDSLNGLSIVVTDDATTPANIGLVARIETYVSASGTITVSPVIGAITSGITKFKVTDTDDSLVTPAYGKVLVSDATSFWVDVTLTLAHVASITDPEGAIIVDTPVVFSRMRFKKVTTNATNSAIIEITRGR